MKLIVFTIFTITIAVYIPSLFGSFVYDDFIHIANNNTLLYSNKISDILFPGRPDTRPLFNLVNRLQFEIHGLNPFSFHIFNLIVHILNGVVLYLLLSKVFNKESGKYYMPPLSVCFATSLFLLHPLQSESVANINNRSGLMMTFFYLTSLFFYALSFRKKSVLLFVCSLVAGIVSQFFKEAALTLVISIYGLDYLIKKHHCITENNLLQKRFFTITPFLLTTIIVPLLLLTVKNPHEQNIGFDVINPWLHFITQWKVVAMFLLKFLVPLNQNIDYDLMLSQSIFEPEAISGLSAIVIITVLCLVKSKKYPLFLIGWLFFLITLSPTNSIVPNLDFAAERHLYMPLIGLSVILASLLDSTPFQIQKPLFVLLILFFMLFTLNRSYLWGSNERLFLDQVEKTPEKDRPYLALAYYYMKENRLKDALAVYDNCLKKTRVSNKRVEVYINMAQVYRNLKEYQRALEMYDKAIAMKRETINAFLGKAALLIDIGELEDARVILREISFRAPFLPKFQYIYGYYLLKAGQPEASYNYLKMACQQHLPQACTTLRKFKVKGDTSPPA